MPHQVENLSYNSSQYLDLYLADKPGQPLVVCLHGGGFHAGSRSDERCTQSAAILLDAGFNCASISYSLAPLEDRFSMWPRNLFDVADALTYLHGHADKYEYDFNRLGMLGFSAGCCLSNLYIHGGEDIFRHFGYETPVYHPAALAGCYGPYHFPSRQPERRSDDEEVNRYLSPSWWLRRDSTSRLPPVLHIQGNRDTVVFPEQHNAFQSDYKQRGGDFKAIVLEDFGHSFAPRDTSQSGETIDLGPEITDFFNRCL